MLRRGNWHCRSPDGREAEPDLIEDFARRLAAAGVVFGHGTDNARDEAYRLLADADAAKGGTHDPEALLKRRIAERLPLPYLTRTAWFGGLPFDVEPGVMIPRSPMAEVLGNRIRPWLADEPRRILDLCCGCGAIGILAALTFPGATVDLADIDVRALACARRNAARHGVADRVRMVRSDLFVSFGERRYDAILCNPPYVPTAELDAAPPEFGHEPRLGLHGGADGLDIWRRIVAALDSRLAPGGVLVGEVGNGSAAFAATFPELGAHWLELEHAEPQADGSFGVFVAIRRRELAVAKELSN